MNNKYTGIKYSLPMTIWLSLFFVIPSLIVTVISFMKKDVFGRLVPKFSLEAYTSLNNPNFIKVIINTVEISIVSTIIIALIIYTMTLEKMKEISIMKLIGIPNSVIIKMIVQETLLLGIIAFISGNIFSHLIYEKFPKRVVLEISDAWLLFIVVIIASILSSFIGVKKVISADPAAAIGG